ncbi:MAG: hypothetical protein R3Y56_06600, partial [Akkermansia sp.]
AELGTNLPSPEQRKCPRSKPSTTPPAKLVPPPILGRQPANIYRRKRVSAPPWQKINTAH